MVTKKLVGTVSGYLSIQTATRSHTSSGTRPPSHGILPHHHHKSRNRTWNGLVPFISVPRFEASFLQRFKIAPGPEHPYPTFQVRGAAARSRAFRFALLLRDNQPLDDFSRSARDVTHLLLAREVVDSLLQRHRLRADPIGRNGYAAFDERNQPREENRHQVLSSE